MGNGDEAHNGSEPPRVRVLPSEGVRPLGTDSIEPVETTQRPRWSTPLLAALAVLVIVFVVFRSFGSSGVPTTTQAPSLSGFEDEYIDLRAAEHPLTATWRQIDFPVRAATITDVILASNVVVAGSTTDSPMVWLSPTGSTWREPSQFELPESGAESIDQVVSWHRDLVALGKVDGGVGIWTAPALATWRYQGQLAGMATVEALVAGPQLLAIGTAEDGGQAAWASDDGLEWTPLGELDGTAGLAVSVFAADDAWYYAGGAEACATEECRPAVYRSADGITWEPTSGAVTGVLDAEPGTVRDIATGDDGLYAVGTVSGGGVAVWHSVDGSAWTRVGDDSPELSVSGATITLISTSAGANPTADVAIGLDRYTVGIGSRIATLAGDIDIDAISETGIEVNDGAAVSPIPLDGSFTLRPSAVVTSVSLQGHRILLAGNLVAGGHEVPVAWTSTDAGLTWHTTILAPSGSAIAAVLSRGNLAVIGTTPEVGFVVWHTTWDTSETQAGALTALEGFVSDLNERNVAGLVAALPEQAYQPADFAVPTLSDTDLGWWDHNGDLDLETVAGTVDYLDAMTTNIVLDDCNTRSQVTDPDTATANCEFVASSQLATIAGLGGETGRIEGTLVDGIFQSVVLREDPYVRMWMSLEAAAATASPAEQATLLATDDRGDSVLQPRFDAESAPIHLEIARRFAEGQLRPGGTITIDTALGTMEWQWLDLPVPVAWVQATAYLDATNEFVLIGSGTSGQIERLSVWTSRDGIEWEEQPGPPTVDSIRQLTPIGDELAGQAWSGNSAYLVFFNGSDWTELELGSHPEGTWSTFLHFAVSGDTALAVTGYWAEDDASLSELTTWLVGPDRTVRTAPAPPDTTVENASNLAGSDEGFIMTTAGPEPGEMTVWHSEDGATWSILDQSTSPEGSQPRFSLEWLGTRYFGIGENFDLWSSHGGSVWNRVVLADSGEPVATYEIGWGPLGYVGVEQSLSDESLPRALYLSADGTTWERVGDFTFFDPAADGWWTLRPMVGTDVIVISGNSYVNSGGTEDNFLLVGRIVDP